MRIMLACHAGISTSMLVAKMKEAAAAEGKDDYKIWAVEQDRIEEEVGNFDILMLGPQVRHIMKRVERIVGDKAPVVVINAMAYGRCDGAAALKQAEDVLSGAK